MAFTDFLAPLLRLRAHSRPIRLFTSTLGLLVASDSCLRYAVRDTTTLSAGLQQVQTPLGWLGLALLLAALLVWLRLLQGHQLSFFYPLWGLAPLGVFLVHIVALDGWTTLKGLFGATLMLLGAGLIMRGGHSF